MAIDTSLLDTKYNNLYQAKLNPLKQQTQVKINAYKQQKQDAQNRYQNIYSALDQKDAEYKNDAYNQANNVDANVNQNLNRVQEIMAKNGWLGGGENLQAQLQSNSDRMNGQGKVTQDLNKYLLDNNNARNTNNLQEQTDYNNLDNQITNAANEGAANETALAQEIASQKADELTKLQQAEADRQFQAEQNALSRQASASKSSSTNNQKAQQQAMVNQAWINFQHQFNDGNAGQWLQENADDIINYLGADEYNKMLDTVRKNADQQMYARRTSNYRIGDGGRMLME